MPGVGDIVLAQWTNQTRETSPTKKYPYVMAHGVLSVMPSLAVIGWKKSGRMAGDVAPVN
jgi:hypothetical protein